MAKAEENSDDDPENFETPAVEGESIQLDPGETLVGEITAYKPWAGENGMVEIEGTPLWLNRTMHQQLIAGLVEGETVLHAKREEEESFEDNDGEEVTYNPRELRFKKDE